jgi:hypothetical protein
MSYRKSSEGLETSTHAFHEFFEIRDVQRREKSRNITERVKFNIGPICQRRPNAPNDGIESLCGIQDRPPFFQPQAAGAFNKYTLHLGQVRPMRVKELEPSPGPRPQVRTCARGDDDYEECPQGQTCHTNCPARRRLVNCRDFLWIQTAVDDGKYCLCAVAFFNEDDLPETLKVLE